MLTRSNELYKVADVVSKANLIDSRFAPAWIAFAHSFAYEGEHDQAITAYSTSARLFQGFVISFTGKIEQG
jgi:hypothetical protein